MLPYARRKKGFSLIEAAIVLAVVGAVIGGIWYAASAVMQKNRINDTVSGFIQLVDETKRLIPYRSFPSLYGSGANVTATVISAAIMPKNFKVNSSGLEFINPIGERTTLFTECATICPKVRITTYMSTQHDSDCIQLIRSFLSQAKNTNELLYVQVMQSPSTLLYLYTPPVDASTVQCPSNTGHVNFWFKPL